jgi:hypothetical protein
MFVLLQVYPPEAIAEDGSDDCCCCLDVIGHAAIPLCVHHSLEGEHVHALRTNNGLRDPIYVAYTIRGDSRDPRSLVRRPCSIIGERGQDN